MNNPLNVVLTSFYIERPHGKPLAIDGFLEHDHIYYTKDYNKFLSVVESLLKSFKFVYVYAHNGAKWDHHLGLLKHFIVQRTVNNDTIKNAKFVNMYLSGDRRLRLRDTRSFFPMPLKKLGQLVHCPKLDCNLETFDPDKDYPYCCRDTEIMVKGMAWLRVNMMPLVNNLKLEMFHSLPDIGYLACLSTIKATLYRFVHWEDYLTLRQCYYGGRVISNCYGEKINLDMVLVDIRSMYPSALTGILPYGPLKGPINFLPLDRLFVALVTIYKPHGDCISAQQPLVPIRLVDDSLAYIDSGRVKAWFTSVDLKTFEMDGWIVQEVVQCVYWDSSSPYAAQFFKDKYEERRMHPKGSPTNECLKLLMNSGYGKFEQFKVGTQECILNRSQPVAWFCTAYSRRILYHCKQLLKCNVYYGDTDSFIISKEWADRLKQTHQQIFLNRLGDVNNGQIQLECEKTINELIVIGKKQYGYICDNGEQIVKCKGIETCTYEQLEKMLETPQYFDELRSKEYWTDKHGCSVVAPLKYVPIKKQMTLPLYVKVCTTCNLIHACRCLFE